MKVLAPETDYDGQYYSAEFDAGNSGSGSITIDWKNGSCQKFTMTGNCTFAAPTNGKAGARYLLRLLEDGTGSRVPTWNAVFKWPGGTAPTLSGANKTDLIALYYDGTNYYGQAALNY